MKRPPVRYTGFQRKVLEAVQTLRDSTTVDVAARVGSTERNTRRSLGVLADRGDLSAGSHDRWYITPKGIRRLGDWGTGL
jgi:hypothetical protein